MLTKTEEVQSYLDTAAYPAARNDLLDVALDEGAGADVIDIIEKLDDREYRDGEDVFREIENLR